MISESRGRRNGEGRCVGDLILHYRRRAGLTQEELAGRSGLSIRMVRDLERNRVTAPRAQSLGRLAGALELTPAEAARFGPSRARIGLLGPLTVTVGQHEVPIAATADRVVLGLLALRLGEVVTKDELVAALWPESPPRTCRAQVQAAVSRLRKALGADAVRTRGGGYLLRLDREQVDAARFDDLAEAAGGADGSLCREALRCWRGSVLADVPERIREHPAARALLRRRSAIAVAYAKLGPDGPDLDLVREVAAHEPLDEPLHAELMLALKRAGDRAGAVRLYGEITARLAAELGVPPGERLLAAYRQVVTDRAPLRPWTVPAQLPRAPESFVGREDELKALDGDAGVALVVGPAGIGKTALVLRWAHSVRESFPDGQLYADLSDGVTVETVLPGFLGALGVPAEQAPSGVDAQAALLRSVLADRRVLMVLDGADAAAQVRPLLPGGAGCRTVVTSRDCPPELLVYEAADFIVVPELTAEQARDLLVRRLGADRVEAEAVAMASVIDRCGGLPLALSVAATQATMNPGAPLGGQPDRPAGLPRLLDHYLSVGFEAARLVNPHRHPIASLSTPDPVPVATMPDAVAARAWFAAEHHSLLALVSVAAAAGLDEDTLRLAWLMRDHLDRRGHWDDWLTVGRAALTAAERTRDRGAVAYALRSLGQACTQLSRYEEAAGHLGRATRLAKALDDPIGHAHALLGLALLGDRAGERAKALRQRQTALGLYRSAGDRAGEAQALNAIGLSDAQLDRYVPALAHCHRALALHETLDDPHGLAAICAVIGGVHHRLDEHAEAIRHLSRGLALYRQEGDLFREASVQARLGDAYFGFGRRAAAEAAWQAALRDLASLDHPRAAEIALKVDGARTEPCPPATVVTGPDVPEPAVATGSSAVRIGRPRPR